MLIIVNWCETILLVINLVLCSSNSTYNPRYLNTPDVKDFLQKYSSCDVERLVGLDGDPLTVAFPFGDPINDFESVIHKYVFGINSSEAVSNETYTNETNAYKNWTDISDDEDPDIDDFDNMANITDDGNKTVSLIYYSSGRHMRAETYQGKLGVHMPTAAFLHSPYCRLNVTQDYMQTAVDAFTILVAGSMEDLMKLPPDYVLKSARAISMLNIAREKLAATWYLIKGNLPTANVSFETLARYRPLFKHIQGREMARLNLSDERILTYIGTHPELNRYQVGVVASQYIRINPNWTQPKYLNIMNNLLCGVPMLAMRRVSWSTYLQLSHQLFYHIRACDPLQRRFYLNIMMKSQVLGKPYSWTARDVSRLGFLLANVYHADLAAINPKSMAGISSQVMVTMPVASLKAITERQLRYLNPAAYSIYTKKLAGEEKNNNAGYNITTIHVRLIILLSFILQYKHNNMHYLLLAVNTYIVQCT